MYLEKLLISLVIESDPENMVEAHVFTTPLL